MRTDGESLESISVANGAIGSGYGVTDPRSGAVKITGRRKASTPAYQQSVKRMPATESRTRIAGEMQHHGMAAFRN